MIFKPEWTKATRRCQMEPAGQIDSDVGLGPQNPQPQNFPLAIEWAHPTHTINVTMALHFTQLNF